MSAAQVQLAAHGQEDQWITAAPNRTYFETKYTEPEKRSRKSVELPFDSQGTSFGTTGQCTISPLGDYLTHLTLRVTLPPIYSIQPGNYVYPTTDVGGVYVQMPTTKIVTQGGTTLTANTNGNHYFSVGASVQISEKIYTITSIPTANSFVCTGISVPIVVSPSTVTTLGLVPVPTVQYYTTQNIPQWLTNLTNKTWNITNTNTNTLTTDSSSNFPVGTQVVSDTGTVYTVLSSTDRTFTVNNVINPINSVTLLVPPLTTTFQTNTYSGLTFANATDAAFWGFDYRQGPVFTTPQLTYRQGGWIPGLLPPSNSTYNDSVAHQLCRAVRILVGKQVIKEYSGEYIELQNDLFISYQNKAILKLMNGTLDQTQSTFARQYYVNIPLGVNEIPLSAMKHQNMSVEIEFEKYTNLSSQLNPGSGNFFDPASYVNTVANSNFSIVATFSFKHYILLLSYTGVLIVYDTEINTYISYQAVAAFQKICIVGHTLYILITNGYLLRGKIDQLINGNFTSFISNFYLPSADTINVITIVADVRYIYYLTQDSTPNLYLTLYDTTQDFLQSSSYTTINITTSVDATVTDAYGVVILGTKLFLLTKTDGTMYIYYTNQWTKLDYTSYGSRVRMGTVINNFIYFIIDDANILIYTNGVFTLTTQIGDQIQNILPVGNYLYASTNSTIIRFDTTKNLAVQQYSSTNGPVTFDDAPKIFATGPRYIYMFTSDPVYMYTTDSDPGILHYTQYDPYTQNANFQASIIADYESTEDNPPDNVLVGIVQTQKVTDSTKMDIRGPVKEIWITGASSSPFQYANLSNQSTLTFAGEQILTPDIGTNTYLGTIQAFETHTSMPVRNMSVLPFELNPESESPNGTVNFSRIRDQVFDGQARTIWVRNYNILSIQGGVGGLMFN